MYVNYITQSLGISNKIASDLMSGSNMFDQNFINGSTQEYDTFSNGDLVSRHDILTQDLVHGPFAFALRPLHLTGFNVETFKNENYAIHHAGGRLFGNFTEVEIPIWNCDNPTVYGDVVSAMFIHAVNGNLQLATAMLRASQLLSSLNTNIPLTHIDAEESQAVRQISLNRL